LYQRIRLWSWEVDVEVLPMVGALLFGGAAFTAAAGSVWVAARFLRQRGRSFDQLRDSIERLEMEVDELREQLDVHARVLRERRDPGRLPRDEA
jgi:hypothetical protein